MSSINSRTEGEEFKKLKSNSHRVDLVEPLDTAHCIDFDASTCMPKQPPHLKHPQQQPLDMRIPHSPIDHDTVHTTTRSGQRRGTAQVHGNGGNANTHVRRNQEEAFEQSRTFSVSHAPLVSTPSDEDTSSMHSYDKFITADEGDNDSTLIMGTQQQHTQCDSDNGARYAPSSYATTIPMDTDTDMTMETDVEADVDSNSPVAVLRKRKQDQLQYLHPVSSDLEKKQRANHHGMRNKETEQNEKPIILRIPSGLALDCMDRDEDAAEDAENEVEADMDDSSSVHSSSSPIVIVPVSPVPSQQTQMQTIQPHWDFSSPLNFSGFPTEIRPLPQDQALAFPVSRRPLQEPSTLGGISPIYSKPNSGNHVEPRDLRLAFSSNSALQFRARIPESLSDMNISQTRSEGDLGIGAGIRTPPASPSLSASRSACTPLKLKQLSAKLRVNVPYPQSPIPPTVNACKNLIRRTSNSKQGQAVRAAFVTQNDKVKFQLQLQKARFAKFKAERATRRKQRAAAKKRSRIIIIPCNHRLKLLWDTLTVCLTFVSAYVGHVYIRDRSTYEWDWFVLFTNVWFFIDVVMNFFTDHRTADGKLLQSGREVWGRYLTTWFAVDALSLLPWERMFLRPIIQMQKRRNFAVKWFFRSKAVVKVTRILRGRHIKAFGKVANNTKRIGVGSKRLLQLIIKYVPKYLLFYRNMKGVLVLKTLRQIHFIKKIFRGLSSAKNDSEGDMGEEEDDDDDLEEEEDDMDIDFLNRCLFDRNGDFTKEMADYYLNYDDIDDDEDNNDDQNSFTLSETDYESCVDCDDDDGHDLNSHNQRDEMHIGNIHTHATVSAIQFSNRLGFQRAQTA